MTLTVANYCINRKISLHSVWIVLGFYKKKGGCHLIVTTISLLCYRPMPVVAPRAERFADAIHGLVVTTTGLVACALAKQLGGYLAGLTVLDGDGLHGGCVAQGEASLIQSALC